MLDGGNNFQWFARRCAISLLTTLLARAHAGRRIALVRLRTRCARRLSTSTPIRKSLRQTLRWLCWPASLACQLALFLFLFLLRLLFPFLQLCSQVASGSAAAGAGAGYSCVKFGDGQPGSLPGGLALYADGTPVPRGFYTASFLGTVCCANGENNVQLTFAFRAIDECEMLSVFVVCVAGPASRAALDSTLLVALLLAVSALMRV